MKVLPQRSRIQFQSDADEGRLVVCHTNRGEPYREGIELGLERGWNDESIAVFIDDWQCRSLRDLLNRLYPVGTPVDIDASSLQAIADTIAADASNASAEQQSQLVRDLSALVAQRETFEAQTEQLATWKARALEAETALKELPTREMVMLAADNYALATLTAVEVDSKRADLQHMIISLTSES